MVSDKSELVSNFSEFGELGGKLPPFGQRFFPVLFEPVSVIDVPLSIEVVVALNLSMARSRLRSGLWLFSARLLSHLPTSCLSSFPIIFMAAR